MINPFFSIRLPPDSTCQMAYYVSCISFNSMKHRFLLFGNSTFLPFLLFFSGRGGNEFKITFDVNLTGSCKANRVVDVTVVNATVGRWSVNCQNTLQAHVNYVRDQCRVV